MDEQTTQDYAARMPWPFLKKSYFDALGATQLQSEQQSQLDTNNQEEEN